MISVEAINLPYQFESYKNEDKSQLEQLADISKINIFVGSNNSGKSRFMRTLSLLDSYDVVISNFSSEILSELRIVIEELRDYLETNEFIVINDLDTRVLQKVGLFDRYFNTGNDKFGDFRYYFKKWSEYSHISSWTGNASLDNEKEVISFITQKSVNGIDLLKEIPIFAEKDNPKKVYIPTLRGLRPIDPDHKDLYAEKTKQDYFSESNNPEIFTGMSLYQNISDLSFGDTRERKSFEKYKRFLSEALFENKTVELVPSKKEKVVTVKIGNEREKPIHHLGDGIQSAIILTFLPFLSEKQTFFFIEEPEIYLHPGLQRKILDFYSSLERHTFFLTTHSNHFLDITADMRNVSIFNFKKLLDNSDDELHPNFAVESVDSGHESSLELLGVRNSSVFLTNCTIWVEGITDRWYLRQMLNSYMDHLSRNGTLTLKLEEDTHYSFVEYGGANITHWSFLDYEAQPIEVKRLCGKAMVVIDGDGEGKAKRKKDLEQILKERLIVLPCREIENLLPYEVIKQVISEYEVTPIPAEIEYNCYRNEFLGKFIENKILQKRPRRKGGYYLKGGTGTLKNKTDFCEKALKHIRYEMLPQPTKDVIQRLYEFAKERNS